MGGPAHELARVDVVHEVFVEVRVLRQLLVVLDVVLPDLIHDADLLLQLDSGGVQWLDKVLQLHRRRLVIVLQGLDFVEQLINLIKLLVDSGLDLVGSLVSPHADFRRLIICAAVD